MGVGRCFQSFRIFRTLAGLCVLGLGWVLLGCGGGAGSSTASGSVPVISSFSASPSTLTQGSATLTWSVSGATSLAIDQGIGTVTGTSVQVSPTQTTTYTLTATNSAGSAHQSTSVTVASSSTVRIILLHHSTGYNIWSGGVPAFFDAYNTAHGTNYDISETSYPSTNGGYPWANYPYDYWNLWVDHTGSQQDLGELNLDQIAAQYDVIIFKHCFPVSAIGPDSDCNPPSISSSTQTVANYQLQYAALKERMHAFPEKKFIVWTGAVLKKGDTTRDQAVRTKQFFDWVKATWDETGDNIFVWDFWSLETAGSEEGLYLNDAYAESDSHPNAAFSQTVAPYLGQRIVDVVEGRGDTGSLTGH